MKIVTKTAGDCSDAEFWAFVELVRAGGEVSNRGLAELIQQAPALVFAYSGVRLVAVSALKVPRASYRTRIGKSCEYPLPLGDFPFELGWVYVSEDTRGQGVSYLVSSAALSANPNAGVFATTRTDNEPMRRTLLKLGFSAVGRPYQSGRQMQLIQVHVRHAAQQAHARDVRSARA